jgi:signal transduction histidine kinase/CheY-like chemotaxis protein
MSDDERGAVLEQLATARAREDHIKKLLLTVRHVNHLIVSEDDPQRLIERACASLTETTGYLSAWIVQFDEAGRTVTAMASSGFEDGLDLHAQRFEAGEYPGCMRRALGRDGIVVVKTPHIECIECPLADVLSGRACWSRRLDHDGKIYGFLSVSVPAAFADDQEEQSLFDETARDLAFGLHRIEANRRLRESQAMLSRAERIAHVGSWEWDIAPDRMRWSDELFRIFRRNASLGAPSFAEHSYLYVPEDLQRLRQAVERCANDGTSYELELRAIRTDGEIRHCVTQGEAETDSQGRIHRLVGSFQDITERKEAEEALEALNQTLQQREADAMAMVAEAEQGRRALLSAMEDRQMAEQRERQLQTQLTQAQKMESVGRLAGGVAHDFNNMLGVILGYAELAMDSLARSDPLYEHIQQISNAANRSAQITRQLLAFARKQPIAPRVLDLNETVEGMLKMLRRLIGENIDLTWLPGKNLWPVKMDPSQIDQILVNLCVNARDAIAGVGRLIIETDSATIHEAECADQADLVPGNYALLTVSDDGCGMAPQTMSNVFEPFFTTKDVGQGTGLGLATVYGIVKQNKGSIQVSSEPGRGTTFRIYLPAYQVAESGVAPEQAADASATRPSRTILLVEDEPAILRMTKMMLERLGYAVLPANTPDEALDLARKYAGQIHLLVTDVVMPEMNGRDLAQEMLAFYPDIKRLFMSGYTADVIAPHGVLDEGEQFLQKPFSIKDLTAKVRLALGEP